MLEAPETAFTHTVMSHLIISHYEADNLNTLPSEPLKSLMTRQTQRDDSSRDNSMAVQYLQYH